MLSGKYLVLMKQLLVSNKRLSFLGKLPNTGNDVVTYLHDFAIHQ